MFAVKTILHWDKLCREVLSYIPGSQAGVLKTSSRLVPHKTLSLLRPLQPGLLYDSGISYLIHELQKLGLRKLVLPSYHHQEPALIWAQK